jgi:hypothetical protein
MLVKIPVIMARKRANRVDHVTRDMVGAKESYLGRIV